MHPSQSVFANSPTVFAYSQTVSCTPHHLYPHVPGKCIPRGWLCDTEPDCGESPSGSPDLSDESPSLCRANTSCPPNLAQCRDGSCRPVAAFCDNHLDCPDNSDEGPFCDRPGCRGASCSHGCSMTWQGAVCYCPAGQEPDGDGRCVDANECRVEGSCDQVCHDRPGSFSCSCLPGYHLEGAAACRAVNRPEGEPPSLLFANNADVQRVWRNGSLATGGRADTHDTLAVDFDHRNGTVCWVEHRQVPGFYRVLDWTGLGLD